MEAGSTNNVLADRLNGDSKPGFLRKPGFFVFTPGLRYFTGFIHAIHGPLTRLT
jgi:hypothetical protein